MSSGPHRHTNKIFFIRKINLKRGEESRVFYGTGRLTVFVRTASPRDVSVLAPQGWDYRHVQDHTQLSVCALETQTQVFMLAHKVFLPTKHLLASRSWLAANNVQKPVYLSSDGITVHATIYICFLPVSWGSSCLHCKHFAK